MCVLLKCLSLPDRAGLRYLQAMRDPLPAIHRTRGRPGKNRASIIQTKHHPDKKSVLLPHLAGHAGIGTSHKDE